MPASRGCHWTTLTLVSLALAGAALAAAIPMDAHAADTPRRGGILLAAIGADAPSLDPHQESTFATLHLVAPLYSTLLQVDPYHYPKVIGDVATEWKVKNYVAPPNHYANQKLQDVWLSED